MFSHIMVGANDVETARAFYDAILGELGHKPGVIDSKGRYFYRTKTGVFAISKPIDGARTLPVFGKAPTVIFISPIYVIHRAIKYAPCTVWDKQLK